MLDVMVKKTSDYPRTQITYGQSVENFLTDFQIGATVVGGGCRVRNRRQASISRPAFIPAFALTVLPNPSLGNKLFSIMLWIIEPNEVPAVTIDIARARFLRKY
jgi:hypothetical protein